MTAGLPRAFRRIRLELAREPGFPSGSRRHGYVFVAPLDPDGRIDARIWKEHRDECRVVRFRPGEETVGHLVRRGEDWTFRYAAPGSEAETGFRFGAERFVAGEYVSLGEHGRMRTFRVASVAQL